MSERSRRDRLDEPAVLLATDLDGTIAFRGERPGPRIRSALSRIADDPYTRVVLATSRTPRTVRDWFGPLADEVDLLCCNGALHVRPGGGGAHRVIPAGVVQQLVTEVAAAGEDFCLEYGDHFVASSPAALPWMGVRHRTLLSPRESPQWHGVLKLCVAHAEPWTHRLAELGGTAIETYPHHTGDLDVVRGGVSKASALRWLSGRPAGRGPLVVAFGNDHNDLEMLLAADIAVVVGDQLPELDGLEHVRRVDGSDDALVEALHSAERSAARWRLSPREERG